MKIRKDEFLLLLVTYILCIALFGNLALLSNPADKRALIIGGIVCFVIMFSHFIIRKFYPEGDKFLLIFSCILSAIGIAMLYRIDYTYAVKQIIWFVLGIFIFILTVVFLPRMKKLSTLRYLYLALTIIFMLLAPLFAEEIYGAKNWIYIAGIGIQPSEFGKITLVLYLSSALKGYSGKEKTIKQLKNLIEPALVTIFSLGCLVYQTDLGSALIFFGISISLLYVATSKKKYVVL
ncbi:MAG: FtsW/RodA/SpoVE family cell cycle protein, partial [Clostridium sp.]|nr:FtsW/RodA/SpoVE family cell cycle protein [Clostridium sp.]